MLPDFVEYLFCWLADDRLCGAILSGVASDAGTHAQINAQESVFCEHAAEVDRALASRYSAITDPLVSFFNFETYQALPQITALPPEDFLSAFQRLVTTSVDGEPSTQLETHYCGPSFLLPSRKKSDSEIPTAATHSTQASSQAYANEETVVIHDFKVERYVRTIESIHVFENLVYLSRVLAETIGKRLNSERLRGRAKPGPGRDRSLERIAPAGRGGQDDPNSRAGGDPLTGSSRRSMNAGLHGRRSSRTFRSFFVSFPSWNSTMIECPSAISQRSTVWAPDFVSDRGDPSKAAT